jgi:hypothetical protein
VTLTGSLTSSAKTRTDLPTFAPGDTLKVMVRVREGDKGAAQAFEGVCTALRGGGISERHGPEGLGRRRRRAHLPAPWSDRRLDREWCAAAAYAAPSCTT